VLAAALVAAVMLLPVLYLVIRVAGAADALPDLLLRRRVLELLVGTVGFAAAVMAGGLAIGVPVAWLTVRSDLPGRRFWSVALALPLVVPSYVGGYVYVAALGPRGMLQEALEPLAGVERLPEIYGFGGATVVLVAFTYPYVFLSVRAALLRLDPALEEAARSMGHGPLATFRRVVLPQLRPGAAAGAALVCLYALGEFGAVSLLRFDTFTRVIYVQYQASFDRTMAAALALVLVVLTGVVLALEARTRVGARYHRSTGGATRPPTPVPLGRARWPALAFCALLLLWALVLPVGVLLYWFARGVGPAVRADVLGQAIVGSVEASALAALAAVLAALPVAILAARGPSRAAVVVERLTYVGYALPGIVVALALVFFGANFAPFLYQTLAMLVLAYVVRFLPQAVGAAGAALAQVSPHLEEAARGLGRTPGRAWREVTLPLILPGLASGAALVFLTAMKELPATLLLSPIGFRTLATATWSAASEGLFAQAAVPALLLVLCSLPPLYALLGREELRARQRTADERPPALVGPD
jgi:iron(III) transport system permease protein